MVNNGFEWSRSASGGAPSWATDTDYTWNFSNTQIWSDSGGNFNWEAIDPSTITGISLIFDTGVVYGRLATSSDNNNGILLNYIQIEGGNPVPEPETVWMIVAVLASLGVTFRRQLTALVTRA